MHTSLQTSTAVGLEPPAAEPELGGPASAMRPVEEMPRDSAGLVRMDLPPGRVYEGEVPSGMPMAPGSLRHVEVKARQSWTNRTILEIAGMLLALVAPHITIITLLSEKNAARLMPLASLIGGALLVVVGMSAPHYTFGGLRPARPRFYLGALVVCGLFVAAAVGWTALVHGMGGAETAMSDEWTELRRLMGLPLLLAVIAIGPAVFEELAFRGLLQGRLTALLGRTTGITATAAFFALAHGISWASPFHIGLGVVLGLLRDRSGSLLPGMLLHFCYNGTLVLLFT